MYCQYCGKEFQPRHGNQKYCCEYCRTEAKRILDQQYYHEQEKTVQTAKCEYCGEVFVKNHGNQKYCSNSCQYHAELEQNAESRMKSYHRHKKRGGDKFWGIGTGGLGAHMHDDPEVELLKINNELKRLSLK